MWQLALWESVNTMSFQCTDVKCCITIWCINFIGETLWKGRQTKPNLFCFERKGGQNKMKTKNYFFTNFCEYTSCRQLLFRKIYVKSSNLFNHWLTFVINLINLQWELMHFKSHNTFSYNYKRSRFPLLSELNQISLAAKWPFEVLFLLTSLGRYSLCWLICRDSILLHNFKNVQNVIPVLNAAVVLGLLEHFGDLIMLYLGCTCIKCVFFSIIFSPYRRIVIAIIIVLFK